MVKRSKMKFQERLDAALRNTGSVASEKAAIVAESWKNREDSHQPLRIEGITFFDMRVGRNEESGRVVLDVWTEHPSRSPEPQIQVLNPPLLAASTEGTIQVSGRSELFSEDPVTAVAQGISRIISGEVENS